VRRRSFSTAQSTAGFRLRNTLENAEITVSGPRLAYYLSAHTSEPETCISIATIGAKRFSLEVLGAEAKTLK